MLWESTSNKGIDMSKNWPHHSDFWRSSIRICLSSLCQKMAAERIISVCAVDSAQSMDGSLQHLVRGWARSADPHSTVANSSSRPRETNCTVVSPPRSPSLGTVRRQPPLFTCMYIGSQRRVAAGKMQSAPLKLVHVRLRQRRTQSVADPPGVATDLSPRRRWHP